MQLRFAQRYCNINLKLNDKITVVFHNVKKYDSYLIMQELLSSAKERGGGGGGGLIIGWTGNFSGIYFRLNQLFMFSTKL